MATYFNIDGYNSYSGCDAIVTAQLANINEDSSISKNCYVLGSLQTLSVSTHQDKVPVRCIGNINAIDYTMGQRTIAGSMVFAVFDRHFADEIFNDLKQYTNGTIILADEIPALNLTISLANEYGSKSRMALYGVKFVDEGQVLSINDLYTENTFQFVAVGLDPLTAEERTYADNNGSNNNKREKEYIKSNIPFDKYKGTSFAGGAGGLIDSGNKGNITGTNSFAKDDENDGKEPYFSINQPIVEGNKGIVSVDLDGFPNIESIITNNKNNDTIRSSGANLNNNIWYVELNEGSYNIKFLNTNNNKETAPKHFVIRPGLNTVEDIKDDYPIIIGLTHKSADIEANNSKHDLAKLTDRTVGIEYEPIKLTKKTFTLDENTLIAEGTGTKENLVNGNVYELYTYNSVVGPSSKSKSIIFSPLENEDYDVELLEYYVKSNRDLWVNDFDTFDFDRIRKKEESNLIDKVLNMSTVSTRAIELDENKLKQELLLYAIKLQNELSLIYNKAITDNYIHNNNILNLDIQINESVDRINLYRIKNNKAYYMYSIDKQQDDMKFYGTPNIRYYLQPIFNQCKGIPYNYCCFSSKTKEDLEDYSNINNLYTYDIEPYRAVYPKYSKEFIYALVARDNYNSDKYMINGPYCYYENERLYVDVDYSETLQKGDYYLCIASIYEVLDHMPIRKCKFNTSVRSLILDSFKTSITKNNYYLVWIEDKNFNSMCKPSILCTYEDNSDLLNYESTCIKNYVKDRITAMKARYSYTSILDSIYLSLISETLSFKNAMYRTHQEFLEQFYDSSFYLYLDDLFYDLIRQDYDSSNLACSVQQKDKMFTFNSNMNDTHLVLIDYKIGEELPAKSTIYDTNTINLTDKDSDYTLVYMLDESMFHRSGFLLVNNTTGKVYNYNISLEVIK